VDGAPNGEADAGGDPNCCMPPPPKPGLCARDPKPDEPPPKLVPEALPKVEGDGVDTAAPNDDVAAGEGAAALPNVPPPPSADV